MSPVDVYLDLTPIATEQLQVQTDSGSLGPSGWGLPPIGGGVDAAMIQFGRLDLSASLDLAQRTNTYDLALDWAPTLWSIELDFGIRIPMNPSPHVVELAFVAGPGLRAELLAQPWWPDYLYAGIGGHVGFDATVGSGSVRLLLGVRASVALVPGAVQGTLDSALQDVTWDYSPLGARLGVHAGVAFR